MPVQKRPVKPAPTPGEIGPTEHTLQTHTVSDTPHLSCLLIRSTAQAAHKVIGREHQVSERLSRERAGRLTPQPR